MTNLPRYSFCEKQGGTMPDGPASPPAAFLSTYERNFNAELNDIKDSGSIASWEQHLDYPARRNKRKRSLLFILAVSMVVTVVVMTAVVASLLVARVPDLDEQESLNEAPQASSQIPTITATLAQPSSTSSQPTMTTVSSLVPTTISQISTATIFTVARPTETTPSSGSAETITTTENRISVTTTSVGSSQQTSASTPTSSSSTSPQSSSNSDGGITIVPLHPTTIDGKSTLLPRTAMHSLTTA